MQRPNASEKQRRHMAAVEANRAAVDVLESMLIEAKGMLEKKKDMSQSDMKKMVSSMEVIKKTVRLAETVNETAVGHYTNKVHGRIVVERRRTNATHRTPEKVKRRMRLERLQEHNENLTGLIEGGRDATVTKNLTCVRSKPQGMSRTRLKV